MRADRRRLWAFLFLALVMLFWAGTSIVGRAVRNDIGPFTLAFLRWALAGLVIFPFAVGPLKKDWPAIIRGWKALMLLGLLGVAAYNTILYSGLRRTTATNALLLQAAMPLMVVAFQRLLFGDRSPWGQLAGVSVSVLGVLVIVFEGDPETALRMHFGIGDGLVLVAISLWALYTVLLRFKPAISPISLIATTFLVGIVTLAPFALWEGQVGPTINWSQGIVTALIYVALLPSLAAFFMYNHAASVLGSATAGQATTMMPLFGAFFSSVILGEQLYYFHFAGITLILFGTIVAAITSPREIKAD
jgi:drug/metabolite transporter (DMT)-like permease